MKRAFNPFSTFAMYIPMAEAADSVELLMVGNGGGGLDRSGIWAGMDHLSLFISDVRKIAY